jgi:hypothetical protein
MEKKFNSTFASRANVELNFFSMGCPLRATVDKRIGLRRRLAPGLVVGRYIGNSIYRVDIWYIVSYRYRGHFIEKFDIFST